MRITLLQTDIRWHDMSANTAEAARLIDTAPGSDLYLLPEMWATGFDTEPSYDLIAVADKALDWMRAEARQRDAAVAGSVAVRVYPEPTTPAAPDDEAADKAALWRNRFYFVTPEGEVTYYDKRNLFVYGGEQLTYSPGRERVIVTWRGVRFMLQTCFDLRFPETARNGLADCYDVLLYVANWPASRRTAWDTLLTARAIENQACCIGVNRTGSAPHCLYDGGSRAVDAYGRPLAVLDNRPQAVTVTPDLERQRAFREKFSVLR